VIALDDIREELAAAALARTMIVNADPGDEDDSEPDPEDDGEEGPQAA
jgi:hypothetical protein